MTSSRPSPRPIHIGGLRPAGAFVLALAAAVLRVLTHLRWHRAEGFERTILILEPFGMGDVISTEPMVRLLASNGWDIRFCARRVWQPLMPPGAVTRWIDAAVPWTHYDTGEKYRPAPYVGRAFRGMFRELRAAGHGAIGLDPRGDIRSVLLLYLAGCRDVVSLPEYCGSDLRMPGFAARVLSPLPDAPKWRLDCQLAAAVGCALPPTVAPPTMTHLLAGGSTATPTSRIAFVPVTPWRGRHWDDERWRNLDAALRTRGMTPCVLCGPGQEAPARLAAGPDTTVVTCSSLQEWARNLSTARLVITLNTGPMHLAAALGRPMVVVDGPTQLPLWEPCGCPAIVVHHQDRIDCAPCHPDHDGVRCGTRCMKAVSVHDILDAVDALLRLPHD